MKVLATVKLELVRQEGRWEACEGCPAIHDPFTKGSLCKYLSNMATEAMNVLGGFASCGGGATWRVVPELTEQLRERIAYALTPHFERNGGPTPDYTGEGSAWVPPVEAPAVVVPELTEGILSLACGCAIEPAMGQDAIKYGIRTAKREGYRKGWEDASRQARAIPADRVLGEGEVKVLREDVEATIKELDYLWPTKRAERVRTRFFDALRANQGGTAT